MLRKELRIPVGILLLIAVGLACLYLRPPTELNWTKDATLNLFTEIVGILLTVFLIDSILSHNKRRERDKIRKIAFRGLKFPLIHHLSLFTKIFKASIEAKPNKTYNHHSDLFDDTFFSEIAFFDFLKPAPITPTQPWATYIYDECKKFEKSLNQILDRYSLYLESDTIDLIELLISTRFMYLMFYIPAIIELDKRNKLQREYNFFGTDGLCEFVKDHTTLLSELIDLYNSNFPDEKIKISADINAENVFPRIGSARISNQDNDSTN